MEPLVTIIVPVFNRASLVIETLESIFRQTYRRIELLVIDDGSGDTSVPVVQQWIEQHRGRFENVHLHPFPKNRGKSHAVNFGFDHAAGEFIMVFDSDDLLLDDAIANEIAFFRSHPETDCLCAGAFLMHGSTRTEELFHPYRGQGDIDDLNRVHGDFFLKGNPVISSTVLMKQSVVKKTGGLDASLRITHDWDYWIRVTQQFTFSLMNRPVMFYRANADGSISQNKLSLFLEVMRISAQYGRNYHRFTLMRTVLYQIKYHLWLAKNDRAWRHCIKIMLSGTGWFIRLLLRGQ